MKLIGIAGRKGSGKDTAAKPLVEQAGFEVVKMAGGLKAMTLAFMLYCGMAAEEAMRCIEGTDADKNRPLAIFGGKSTRFFMQKLGTEFGRDMIWKDIWTNAFKLRATQFPKVACTDVRFPNEPDLIHDLGGVVVRINNPNSPRGVDDHPSETGIDFLEVDYEIENDGTIEDLQARLRAIAFSNALEE